jgi:hypothetical protein
MKAAPNETHEEAKRELIRNIVDNSKIPDFADIVNRVVPNPVHFSQTRFADFIILSVPKVICQLADAHCKVEVIHRAKYSRQGFKIAKFVFRFDKRRRKSLRLYSPEYAHNIEEIMRLDNVKTIGPPVIGTKIRTSHERLKAYIMKLDQEIE